MKFQPQGFFQRFGRCNRQIFQTKPQSHMITLPYTSRNCSRNYSNSKDSKKTMKYQKSKYLVTITVSTVAITNFKIWFSQNCILDFLDKMRQYPSKHLLVLKTSSRRLQDMSSWHVLTEKHLCQRLFLNKVAGLRP